MSPSALSLIFVAVLLLNVATRLWLAQRQIRAVRAHRDRVPAAFADSISLTAHQKAADYTQARMRVARLDVVVGTLWVLLLTLGGGLDVLQQFWANWFNAGSVTHGVALLASLTVLSSLIDLPFALYREFVIDKGFGFSRMTAGLFVADLLRSAALGAAIGLPLLALVLWMMDSLGSNWWLWVWLVWLGFNFLSMLASPTLIAPLFNKFTPLEDEALKARVSQLLQRCGFKAQGLYVMDGSRRSAHGNAYFTGLGASKRIVFFDTLLARLQPAEIEAVLAHELGHFKHGHIWKRIGVMALASLALLALLGWLMQQPLFYAALGVAQPGTAVALALFSLALPPVLFPLAPLFSHWSRKHEYEADAYASQQASGTDLVSALVKLYRDNAATLTPDVWYSRFYDSHPPAALRIAQLQREP